MTESNVRVYTNRRGWTFNVCRSCDRIRMHKRPLKWGPDAIDHVVVMQLADGRGPRGSLYERRAATELLLKRKMPYSEIARRLGVHVRTIERYATRKDSA